jgi:hypothetical protein
MGIEIRIQDYQLAEMIIFGSINQNKPENCISNSILKLNN